MSVSWKDEATLAQVWADVAATLTSLERPLSDGALQLEQISNEHRRKRHAVRQQYGAEMSRQLEGFVPMLGSGAVDVAILDLQPAVFLTVLEQKVLTNDLPFEETEASLVRQREEKRLVLSGFDAVMRGEATMPRREEKDDDDDDECVIGEIQRRLLVLRKRAKRRDEWV